MFTCGLLRSNFSLLICIPHFEISNGDLKFQDQKLEPKSGFEPETSSLPRMRSTPELLGRIAFDANAPKLVGAGDETRTRDIQLGRLTLYQLSYSRKNWCMG